MFKGLPVLLLPVGPVNQSDLWNLHRDLSVLTTHCALEVPQAGVESECTLATELTGLERRKGGRGVVDGRPLALEQMVDVGIVVETLDEYQGHGSAPRSGKRKPEIGEGAVPGRRQSGSARRKRRR